jgi:hypothetical protein
MPDGISGGLGFFRLQWGASRNAGDLMRIAAPNLRPNRRELIRCVVALEPIVDEAIREASRIVDFSRLWGCHVSGGVIAMR